MDTRPTEKQANALRKFGIPEEEIKSMSFSQASGKLDELIKKARGRDSAPSQSSQQRDQARTLQKTSVTGGAGPASGTGSAITSQLPQGNATPSLPEDPKVLTEQEIMGALLDAKVIVAKAFSVNPQSLSIENALVAVAFSAKLKQQEQRFNAAMNKKIEHGQLENYRRWKEAKL